MTTYLTNAFSINMLPRREHIVIFRPIHPTQAENEIKDAIDEGDFVSAIGHASTAAILSKMLGVDIEAQRVNVEFDDKKDILIVAQYRGPRLEEGATELPEGATIEFWSVS